MRKYKIIISILLCALILSAFPFKSTVDASAFSTVTVHFTVADIPTLSEGNVTFSIYDGYDASFLDTKVFNLRRGIQSFDLTFDVPAYTIGKKFIIRLIDGAEIMKLDDSEGKEFTLETYSYPSPDGTLMNFQTTFYISLEPFWSKTAEIHVEGIDKTFYAHCFMGDELYVTTDLLSALGINYSYSPNAEYPNMFLTSPDGGYTCTFYTGNVYALRGGVGYNLNYEPFDINGFCYVPLYDVAVYFACSYQLTEDTAYRRTISLKPSAYKKPTTDSEQYVNGRSISSKTNYMIWVSKSTFTVHAFIGSDGNWSEVASFPCAIGAPSSPTVEGSFEYYQYQTRWTYGKFYCGPIMRFHNGYALHSTLISYSGKPYDNRVGVRISHGCVRIRPDGINWLAQNIPLYTRVLVTA